MANETKACNLTEAEIYNLIGMHGKILASVSDVEDMGDSIERINYLNKRLKAFKEPDAATETKPAPALAMDAWGKPAT